LPDSQGIPASQGIVAKFSNIKRCVEPTKFSAYLSAKRVSLRSQDARDQTLYRIMIWQLNSTEKSKTFSHLVLVYDVYSLIMTCTFINIISNSYY